MLYQREGSRERGFSNFRKYMNNIHRLLWAVRKFCYICETK